MDLRMPIEGVMAATREITRRFPNARVLVLTSIAAGEIVVEALRSEANAYRLQDAPDEELIETVRALMRDESLLKARIALSLFLAEGTVKSYNSQIMSKPHANTRAKLAIRNLNSGVVARQV